MLEQIKNPDVAVQQWKQVCDDKDDKYRVKIVSTTKTTADFKTKFLADFDKFTIHSSRAQAQYQELKHLKEKLPENDLLIKMDFTEDFTCASTDSVQSA